LLEPTGWAGGLAVARSGLGFLALSAGQPAAAVAALAPLAEAPFGDGAWMVLGLALPDLVEALIEVGECDRAAGVIAHPNGGSCRPPGGRRAHQSRDRNRPFHQSAHGRDEPVASVRETGDSLTRATLCRVGVMFDGSVQNVVITDSPRALAL